MVHTPLSLGLFVQSSVSSVFAFFCLPPVLCVCSIESSDLSEQWMATGSIDFHLFELLFFHATAKRNDSTHIWNIRGTQQQTHTWATSQRWQINKKYGLACSRCQKAEHITYVQVVHGFFFFSLEFGCFYALSVQFEWLGSDFDNSRVSLLSNKKESKITRCHSE